MKICDKCDCESSEVSTIKFGSEPMDVCPPCLAKAKKMVESAKLKVVKRHLKEDVKRNAEVNKAANDAWAKWKASDGGLRVKVRQWNRIYTFMAAYMASSLRNK